MCDWQYGSLGCSRAVVTVVYSIPHPYYAGRIEACSVEYPGGDFDFEFRVFKAGRIILASCEGYGNPVIALRDGLIAATAADCHSTKYE